jgi:hypothetical protein
VYRHPRGTGYRGNDLTLEYPVSDFDTRLCRFTDMLLQWQYQAIRYAGWPDGGAGGLLFVFRGMDAAGEIEQFDGHQALAL